MLVTTNRDSNIKVVYSRVAEIENPTTLHAFSTTKHKELQCTNHRYCNWFVFTHGSLGLALRMETASSDGFVRDIVNSLVIFSLQGYGNLVGLEK